MQGGCQTVVGSKWEIDTQVALNLSGEHHGYIEGHAGDDELDGGAGDDLLSGGAGRDIIRGGEGDDYIFGGGTYNGTRLRSPNSTPYQPPANARIIGATWAVYPTEIEIDGEITPTDTLQAVGHDDPTDEGDYIDAGAGNDYVDGGYGDDVIDGGEGNDTLRGGAGNDAIEGGAGDDDIRGDNTRFGILIGDIPTAAHGNDVLSGGSQFTFVLADSRIHGCRTNQAINQDQWKMAA